MLCEHYMSCVTMLGFQFLRDDEGASVAMYDYATKTIKISPPAEVIMDEIVISCIWHQAKVDKRSVFRVQSYMLSLLLVLWAPVDFVINSLIMLLECLCELNVTVPGKSFLMTMDNNRLWSETLCL